MGVLNQIDAQLATEHSRGTHQSIELHMVVIGIENSFELRTAGSHRLGHLVLAHVTLFHSLLQLPCQHALHRYGCRFLQCSLLGQEILEG